ncbi:DNA methylase and ParB-like domain protein (plasmid) [Candidatus Trichorickettsia mobilis]|uniref:Methyltransferase n=1 Tax=Candidatus Trichorickettsia mobilis TaxID=1346319 RepID=A0ABZ0UWE5_9RICK|nr:DNA methyltransferase [Candidatus Trichorickettsia mobilis]WPY01510.1 DNA methylase and ParB-like domain protein [Candidatus Trichorickettsia mobilis]
MIKWNPTLVKISELKEYNNNPRKIGNKELEKLTSHIQQDGYHQRIIVNNDYTIIGGHQRKKALLAAGYKEDDSIEVLMPDKLLGQEELDRINIRDNLPFGEYDFDILSERFDLETLVDFGMPEDMLVGFGEENLLTSEDEIVGDLPTEPKSKLGDLYILGNHRLLCGDSTNPEHVSRLLDEENPILMVTDPPYGVNYEPEWRNDSGQLGVAQATGKVLNDHRFDWSEAYSLFAGDIAYVWHPSGYTHKFAENIENCDFKLINLIIWVKQHLVFGRGDYHHQYEACWYAVRKGKTHNWQGKRDQVTVWHIDNFNGFGKDKEEQTNHSTQKPLECMLRPILNNSEVGEGVYDPFGGSGTTLIACEKSKRNCYMMELSPAYVDLIVARWEKETGEKAVLINE